MTFISGWIGLLSALDPAGAAAVTEATGVGYARQPVRFSTPRNGISKLAAPFTFGFAKVGETVGRAIYTQPTGGDLLFVLPYGTGSRPMPGGGPIDARDVGEITLFLASMAAYPDGAAYTGKLAWTGAPNTISAFGVGTVYDVIDEGNAAWALQPIAGGVVPKAIMTAPLYASFGNEPSVQNGTIIVTTALAGA